MKNNDTKRGVHCGACKMFVEHWEEHLKTDEHKRHAAVIQPAIDRVLNGSAASIDAALREEAELNTLWDKAMAKEQAELDAAKKRMEKNIKALKLRVEEKE